MSAIHILDLVGSDLRAIHHFAAPIGANSAGLAWKDVLLAAGLSGSTRLTEGTGPGQISTIEKAQIVAGNVLEVELTVALDQTAPGATIKDAILAEVTQARTEFLRAAQARLRVYGLTR